jgi:hypothetical protein
VGGLLGVLEHEDSEHEADDVGAVLLGLREQRGPPETTSWLSWLAKFGTAAILAGLASHVKGFAKILLSWLAKVVLWGA